MIITIRLPISPDLAARITAAGHGSTVHHPRARTRAGRRELSRALTHAGVPTRIVKTLAWSCTGEPPNEAAPEPKTERKSNRRKAFEVAE